VIFLPLAACYEGIPKHLKPLSDEAQALLSEKKMAQGSPVFMRIFKEEAELEVWVKRGPTFTRFKTYKICNWSGLLGPKLKEGDRQAPEGFYLIKPGQMNPFSKYHLSFNLGYPNAYDVSLKRTGTFLMVHGGCSSAGCYAVTDENVQEIYSLSRDAFLGGQRAFHVQAFPFRLTQANLDKHKDNKWHPFWSELKAGFDLFNATHVPPKIGVKDKKYVVEAAPEKELDIFAPKTGSDQRAIKLAARHLRVKQIPLFRTAPPTKPLDSWAKRIVSRSNNSAVSITGSNSSIVGGDAGAASKNF
jgi:murein L,D-transpeptidase YafK